MKLLAKRFPIVRKLITDIIRERTFVLLLGLLTFVALSIGALLATVAIIYNPTIVFNRDVVLGVVGDVQINDANIKIIKFANVDRAYAAFDNSTLDGILIVRGEKPTIIDVITPSSPVISSVVLSAIRPYLETSDYRLRTKVGDVWPSSIEYNQKRLMGSNVMYEILIGFLIPLFALLGAFVLGNLLVDFITQDVEQKTLPLILTAVSIKRYVFEHVVFATICNAAVCSLLLSILWFKIPFFANILLIFIYAMAFGVALFLYAVIASLLFSKKEISQTVFSFGVLSIFLLSPFYSISPIQTVTFLLINNTQTYMLSMLFIGLTIAVLVAILYAVLKIKYVD